MCVCVCCVACVRVCVTGRVSGGREHDGFAGKSKAKKSGALLFVLTGKRQCNLNEIHDCLSSVMPRN